MFTHESVNDTMPLDQRVLFHLIRQMSQEKLEICETAVSIVRRKKNFESIFFLVFSFHFSNEHEIEH